jgi:hypothetical protein
MSIIASTILLSLLTAPPPRLRINVSFEGLRMWQRREAAAMDEVAGIWRRYGVEVRSAPSGTIGRDADITLAVVLTDRSDRRVPDDALGSIQFFDESPEPRIVMYPNTIATLMSEATFVGLKASEWSVDLRERLIGRVLGRALAHEIGHFLLRSRGHSAAGLMRARPAIADLVANERQPFGLLASEVERLAAVAPPSVRTASH